MNNVIGKKSNEKEQTIALPKVKKEDNLVNTLKIKNNKI